MEMKCSTPILGISMLISEVEISRSHGVDVLRDAKDRLVGQMARDLFGWITLELAEAIAETERKYVPYHRPNTERLRALMEKINQELRPSEADLAAIKIEHVYE